MCRTETLDWRIGGVRAGQILSGQRLVAQLAARGASDDVERLRRQQRPPQTVSPLQTYAHHDSSSDVPVFSPPKSLFTEAYGNPPKLGLFVFSM